MTAQVLTERRRTDILERVAARTAAYVHMLYGDQAATVAKDDSDLVAQATCAATLAFDLGRERLLRLTDDLVVDVLVRVVADHVAKSASAADQNSDKSQALRREIHGRPSQISGISITEYL